jgi:VIT1/CCC1 family predicted Fe2+/Mn2+ transporter
VTPRGRHVAASDARPGERMVRVGAAVFALGLVGVLLAVVPFFLGREDAPSWTALLASLLPVGLGLALLGLLRGARAGRRS